MTAENPAAAPAPKKKHKLLKWLLWIGAGFVVLLLVACLLYYFLIDNYIRVKVEEAGKNATGQDVKLQLADLRALSGKLTLTKFNLANPKDFSADGLCNFKDCSVVVNTGSLFTDTIVIEEIVITDLVISIEQKQLRNNLMEIINYVQGQRGQPAAGPPAEPQAAPPANSNAGKAKSLKVNVVRIVHPIVKFDLFGAKTSFELDDIEIKEPTNPNDLKPKMVDLIGKILLQIAHQALNSPRIPGNIQNLLNGSLGKLNDIIKMDSLKDMLKIGGEIKMPNVDINKFTQDFQKNFKGIKAPDFKFPDNIKIPDMKDLKIPDVKMPDMKDIKIPDIKMPEIKNPFETKEDPNKK